LKYQQNVLKTTFKKDKEITFKFDFYGYFRAIYTNDYMSLKKAENSLKFPFSAVPDNWIDFAREIVWFGRKGNSNIFTNLEQDF